MTEASQSMSEEERMVLFMAELGFIYGKYDDQQFHRFDGDVGGSTITRNHATLLYQYSLTKQLEARIDELEHIVKPARTSKQSHLGLTYTVEDRLTELKTQERVHLKHQLQKELTNDERE